MKKLNKKQLARIILIIIVLASVICFMYVPAFKSKLTQVLMLFRSMSVESIIGYIKSFGAWAILISFLLMMFQSVIAPLPAFLITFANAAVFGWWQGAILSWSSAMAGALLCFYIARIAGRDVVEKINKNFSLQKLDEYFDRYGKHTILICRLLPFISFDFISYAAGLTAIKPIPFMISNGLCQLPGSIFYYSMWAFVLYSGKKKLVWFCSR
jgi:uncharacterized membrane protein YdjX (TVP38/TMEM64 family)